MLTIEIKGDIFAPSNDPVISMFGMEDRACSIESVRAILESDPDPDVMVNINSMGGSVDEALGIYDVLRTSGRNISTNIIGACHSAAVLILLAAPYERRSANPNASALIHKVSMYYMGQLTEEEAVDAAEIISTARRRIIDVYEDRTGQSRELLEQLMNEEKIRYTDELMEYRFISKINSYTTNSFTKNNRQMAQKEAKTRVARLLADICNFFGEPKNYDYTDADGKVLFSTDDGYDQVLKVGVRVRIADGGTEGEFNLGDGTVVTIKDNVVTKIEESDDAESRRERERLMRERDEAMNKCRDAEAKRDEAMNLLRESRDVVTSLENELRSIRSTGSPANRIAAPSSGEVAPKSVEELKAESRARLESLNHKNE